MNTEKIQLGTHWFIERPEGGIWFLVDDRDPHKMIPSPGLKVPKSKDKGKILKRILELNELLAQQSDIVKDVFPPPGGL